MLLQQFNIKFDNNDTFSKGYLRNWGAKTSTVLFSVRKVSYTQEMTPTVRERIADEILNVNDVTSQLRSTRSVRQK